MEIGGLRTSLGSFYWYPWTPSVEECNIHVILDIQEPSNESVASNREVRQACKLLADLERFRKRKATLLPCSSHHPLNTQAPRQFNRTVKFCLYEASRRLSMQEENEAGRPWIYQMSKNHPTLHLVLPSDNLKLST